MAHDETFKERVKRLRERTGLSQIEFADKAGLSREGYQKIERGLTRHPDNDSVRAIARAAEVPIGTLSRMLDWIPLDESEERLMSTLSEKQRDIVLQLIEVLRTAVDPSEHVPSKKVSAGSSRSSRG